jgi:type I restriction enzyme S subunit
MSSNLPDGWHRANIRRYASMKTGHTPSRSRPEYWENLTIPWFTLADVWQLRDGRRVYLGDTAGRISELGLANSAAELLPAGTVVLSRTASVGFSGVMPTPMATSQDFWNWICGPDLLPEYLNYQFKAIAPALRALNMGSTHQTIYQRDAAGIEIVVPPLAEQRTIADYLDRETARIDTLIAEQRRLIELLQERRGAVLESGVAHLDWSVPLGAVASLIQTGPFGSQLKSDEYERGGVPVINPSHFVGGEIAPDPRVAVGEAKASDLSRHVLDTGDVIVARRGELGRCAVVDADSAGFICGTGSALIRPDAVRLDPQFLALIFGSRRNKDALALASVGSTMDNLNADIVSALRLPAPPLDEQRRIAAYLDEQTAKIDTLIAETERFIELAGERRSALITAAVTGQIHVRAVA